jgi:aminoglycoside 3-N-acetyltransferase I
MSLTVRRLVPGDIALFKALNRVFGAAFAEPDTYEGAIPSEDYFEQLLRKPHIIPLVALEADTVVGGLVAYVLEKFERQRSEIYIYDLAVDEPYRRRGIATALIRTLREIGKSLGAYVIFVQADHGDDPAIRLYESLGTREDVMHFDIRVE